MLVELAQIFSLSDPEFKLLRYCVSFSPSSFLNFGKKTVVDRSRERFGKKRKEKKKIGVERDINKIGITNKTGNLRN